ncbi:MAG: C40 family peptidase [Verrucomicrobiaceae bacterium]|nr:C40 family peptidase [Verrucomicrobiaceae bacterium]
MPTRFLICSICWCLFASLGTHARAQEEIRRAISNAPPASLKPDELIEYQSLSPDLKALISSALALTKLKLSYTFASADPKRGGMDCSGTMYHLLQSSGYITAPRQSDQMCQWLMQTSKVHMLEGVKTFDDPLFAELRPGDLVFWSGTYEATPRKLPITHVMLYLGKQKKDGKRVLFGASDGRTYEGQRRNGVSVFDFAIPKAGSKATLHSYGPLPAKSAK